MNNISYLIKPSQTKPVWNRVLKWETWEISVASIHHLSNNQKAFILSKHKTKNQTLKLTRRPVWVLTLNEIGIEKENRTYYWRNRYWRKRLELFSSLPLHLCSGSTSTLQPVLLTIYIGTDKLFFRFLHVGSLAPSRWFFSSFTKSEKCKKKVEGGMSSKRVKSQKLNVLWFINVFFGQ